VEITFQVPDSVAARLRASWQDLPRHAGAFLHYTAQDLEEDIRSYLEKTGR
jgi:hypothetical protein